MLIVIVVRLFIYFFAGGGEREFSVKYRSEDPYCKIPSEGQNSLLNPHSGLPRGATVLPPGQRRVTLDSNCNFPVSMKKLAMESILPF